MASRLSPLQRRVLRVLAAMSPRPVLTGGGALVGFYTFHRTTRDIDLFWHERHALGEAPSEAIRRLRIDGLETAVVQDAPYICRLRVRHDDEVTIVDLVADPVPAISPPVTLPLGDVDVDVDTEHEILVNKLCALLSRSELRDLEDVQAILEKGSNLAEALQDAPKKDGGFSPLTLAWVVEQLNVTALGRSLGWLADRVAKVHGFKGQLIDRLLVEGRPSDES